MDVENYVEGLLLSDVQAPLENMYTDNLRLGLIIEPYVCDDVDKCASSEENVVIE